MRTFNIKAASGVRNDIPLERFTRNDLADGVNVDIDETGKISRRKGQRRVVTGTDIHSLAVALGRSFFVDGSTLYELSKAYSKTSLRSGLAVGRRMAYLGVNELVYFSNGVDSGVVDGSTARNMGIAVPSLPTASETPGDLAAGFYGYTITFVRGSDMSESGAPRMGFMNVESGIHFSNIPVSADPDVAYKRIYITAQNGEVPYLAMTLDNSVTSADYLSDANGALICNTQFKGPMPAGQALGIYNGRLYVAADGILWYSESYNYELCDYRSNYIAFPARITIVAPVGGGIFLGTEEETIFMEGDDPTNFRRIPVSPFGSVFGTLQYVDPKFVTQDGMEGLTPMWFTTRGLVAGNTGGKFTELTSERYVLPEVVSGASLYRYKSGTAHLLTSLFK